MMMRQRIVTVLFAAALLLSALASAQAQGRSAFAAPNHGNSDRGGGNSGMFPSPSAQVFAVPAWLTGAGPRPNNNNGGHFGDQGRRGITYYPAVYPSYQTLYPSYYDGPSNYGSANYGAANYLPPTPSQIVVLEPRSLSDIPFSRELLERRLDDQARELDRIRQERNHAGGSASSSGNPNDGEDLQPATILVFKDKHAPEMIHNYAIVGSNLFVMGRNHRKIPLADLDLLATARANEKAGLEFKIPATSSSATRLKSGLGIDR